MLLSVRQIQSSVLTHGLGSPFRVRVLSDKATWGDVQYVFAMYYSDGFPKVFKCENELVKATLMYLDDPDAPEGVAFIRWLAVQDYLGEKINWKDLT